MKTIVLGTVAGIFCGLILLKYLEPVIGIPSIIVALLVLGGAGLVLAARAKRRDEEQARRRRRAAGYDERPEG